jgi:D-3-phosphoglycerate dehydrogenase / 2-oxoglutarate reductase
MNYSSASRRCRVLVTDYAWDSLDVEEKILKKADASLVVAKTGEEEELIVLAADVDGILTCWKPVTQKVIRNAPRCRVISRFGIGLDNIDVAFSTQMGIVVTNVPSYCIEEVSDHAMALLLALARKVAFYDRAIKGGTYDLRAQTPLYRLKGKTLGILGFGDIGKALYRKAVGFGLRVIACDRNLDRNRTADYDVMTVTFSELLQTSDYISIHVPLTPETLHLFNCDAFRQMKRTAFLVNTARGGIIDSQALLDALDEKLIAGAALDVLANEPPAPTDRLVMHPRTVITPHAAFNSQESLEDLRQRASASVAEVLSGQLPNHMVNPEVLKQANLRAQFRLGEPRV